MHVTPLPASFQQCLTSTHHAASQSHDLGSHSLGPQHYALHFYGSPSIIPPDDLPISHSPAQQQLLALPSLQEPFVPHAIAASHPFLQHGNMVGGFFLTVSLHSHAYSPILIQHG